MRVNGHARISIGPALLERLAMDGKPPKCVLVMTVESVYFQCARAIHRAKLWDPRMVVDRQSLPTAGQILSALAAGDFDGATYDRELPARQRDTLY